MSVLATKVHLPASIADQAQLHGVLGVLRDIGAVITEVRATVPMDRSLSG